MKVTTIEIGTTIKMILPIDNELKVVPAC